MSEPMLRATHGSGDVYDDPSEDLLFMLFEDFDELELEQRWFVVDRLESSRHGRLRVALAADGTFAIEASDPELLEVFDDMRAAHHAATRWAFDLD